MSYKNLDCDAFEKELLNLLDTYEENSDLSLKEYLERDEPVTYGMWLGIRSCTNQLKQVLEMYGVKE